MRVLCARIRERVCVCVSECFVGDARNEKRGTQKNPVFTHFLGPLSFRAISLYAVIDDDDDDD